MKYLKQIKNVLKMQNGRSMVEMLGVLAVVGVLSIGAIYGYRFAMDKYHANEIVHGVGMMAMSAQTQIEVTGDFTLDEFRNSDLVSYSFEEDLNDDNSFYITLKEIPQGVCERLKSMAWQEPSAILINDVAEGVCDQEKNNIEFSFSISEGDSDVKKCASTDDCPYCNTCTGGKCVADTLCDNFCSPDKPILRADGSCQSCPEDIYSNFSASSSDECNKCPGDYKYENGTCKTTTCPEGHYINHGNSCVPCSDSHYAQGEPYVTNCLIACPDRVRVGNKCRKACNGTGEFYDSWGQCVSCSNSGMFWSSSCSSKCSDHHIERYYDGCVPNCSSGYGWNTGRCCTSDEVYIQTNTSSYGNWGNCCPKTRPTWNGSKCVP